MTSALSLRRGHMSALHLFKRWPKIMWARKARRVICNNLSAAQERKNVLQEAMKNWFSVPCKWELNEKLVLWLMLPCFTGNIQTEQELVRTIKLSVYLWLVKHVLVVFIQSRTSCETLSHVQTTISSTEAIIHTMSKPGHSGRLSLMVAEWCPKVTGYWANLLLVYYLK